MVARRRWEEVSEALASPIPWITLTAALALSVAGWIGLERNRVDEARQQFERRTETAEAALRARLQAYELVLRASSAFIAADEDEVVRGEWHEFIARLQLAQRFPGIAGIGEAERVPAGERSAHVKRLRATGLTDYDVRPGGERDEFAPVVQAEPSSDGRNARLVGFDMASDPLRRSAMDKTREAGNTAITAKVDFGGDSGLESQGAGFVMFVPVYRGDPARERRETGGAPSGWVFAPIRMQEFMTGLLDAGVLRVVDMQVFDEPSLDPASELIDTRFAWHSTLADSTPTFARRLLFRTPGRLWSIQFMSRPEFDAMVERSRPWMVLVLSLAATFVLFALTTMLVAAWNRAHDLSMRDPLTGLYNRRYLEETMGRELPRARRLGASVGVIVLDIDHFKQLNDTYGHDAGDRVLERTGDVLRAATRKGDIACRFGGEEFAIVLPGATLQVARVRAEAIRAALETMRVEMSGRPVGKLTISAGVAAMPAHAQDWSLTLRRADRALYAAKQSGRNKVMAIME